MIVVWRLVWVIERLEVRKLKLNRCKLEEEGSGLMIIELWLIIGLFL